MTAPINTPTAACVEKLGPPRQEVGQLPLAKCRQGVLKAEQQQNK